MTPFFNTPPVTIYCGPCEDILPNIGPFDSIVTDPPYGLEFMGKKWDYDVPTVAQWQTCINALKPGGHLLAFAGTRTQHRMAVNIEDAGFEIRDMLAWVYGSGFPKSLDVSKAIDKAAGAERQVVGRSNRHVSGKPNQRTAGLVGSSTFSETIGMGAYITAPATPEAQQWQGWGTALKPALEPITMARNPFKGTVADNVLTHGTGALNIDGCRVALSPDDPLQDGVTHDQKPLDTGVTDTQWGFKAVDRAPGLGRFPANLIHDGSDEVVGLFPDSKGQLAASRSDGGDKTNGIYGKMKHNPEVMQPRGDSGSAARFFYCAKASRKERGEGNTHPTVKPIELMRYLCRLVTPPKGTILDPFGGSGTTAIAAIREGFRVVLIERDETYAEIAAKRVMAELEDL